MKTGKRKTFWINLIGVLQAILFVSLMVFLVLKWTSSNPLDDLLSLSLFAGILSLSFLGSYLNYRMRLE